MSTRTYLGMVAAEDLSDMQYKILNVHGANTVKLRVAAGSWCFRCTETTNQKTERTQQLLLVD